MSNPWNKILEIEFDINVKKRILEYYNKMQEFQHTINPEERKKIIEAVKLDDEAYNYIIDLYYNKQYGLKLLARALDLTYSRVRTLLINYLCFDIRKGRSIVTENVKKFRSDRVKGQSNPWAHNIPNHDYSKKSLHGYYRKKDGSLIWLRSSWEYIYAKWLEKNDILFEVEEKRFILTDDISYTPDFFIYDNKHKLQYITEIKGFKRELSMQKIEMFRNKYPEIKLIVIDNMSNYCANYRLEVKIWRQERILNILK